MGGNRSGRTASGPDEPGTTTRGGQAGNTTLSVRFFVLSPAVPRESTAAGRTPARDPKVVGGRPYAA